MKQVEAVGAKYQRKDALQFNVGDTIDVHFTIKEENKMRIQVFSGIVISIKGSGISRNFTVRRISYGEGVERIFPLHSPLIDRIVVKKRGKVRRAKLYYLRQRRGKKATKVKERIEQRKK